MTLSRILLPALGLGLGAALLLPSEQATAWSTIGGSLNHNQRDFRIYNNFTDSTANNNQTPHPQFPGYQGADMAIWKGCIEWSSVAHGNGSGDSTQSVLGSSGANFDPSFQGNAPGVGGGNDNTHSEISGSSGGVLAFCETPISTGWRIRYYSSWTWADGPGNVSGGQFDLQSVACHEYGHALGLGHSNVGGATMWPSTGSGSESGRSINSDDMAGCQAIYGAMSSSKPRVTGVSIVGNTITVNGQNFDPTENQIWFTRSGTAGDGQPVKVANLNSNGNVLSATIPAQAGSGDILVRSNGTANDDLSNPWPVDLGGGGGCSDPQTFCGTSPNSVGGGAQIAFGGSASVVLNNLTLSCTGLVPNTPGLFFYGGSQTSVPLGEGVRCVDGTLTRLDVQVADGGGTVFRSINWNTAPFDAGAGQVGVGDDVNFQYWYRDPTGGAVGNNLSNGLELTLCN